MLTEKPTPEQRPDLYECATCSTKPGTPALCQRCLSAREKAGVAWLGQTPVRDTTPGRDLLAEYARLLRCAWLNPSDREARARAHDFEREHRADLEPLWTRWQDWPQLKRCEVCGKLAERVDRWFHGSPLSCAACVPA